MHGCFWCFATVAASAIATLVVGNSKADVASINAVSADDAYRTAAVAYNSGDFATALKYFKRALHVMPADNPLTSTLEALLAQTAKKIESSGRRRKKGRKQKISTKVDKKNGKAGTETQAIGIGHRCIHEQILQPSTVLLGSDPAFKSAPNPFLAKVYVTPVLSAKECEWIIGLAEKVQDWKSRLSYDTLEVQLDQMPELLKWASIPDGFFMQVFSLMCHQFGLKKSVVLELVNSNVIRYESSSNVTNHVLIHSDGSSMVTFNVLLSAATDFEGGGTGMLHVGRTVFPDQGSMVTYYSNAYHSGEPVTRGKRYIWQGFLAVHGDEALPHQDEMHLLFARTALAVQPVLQDANYNAGNLLRKFGRLDESAGCLRRALDQGHPMPHFVLAQLAETQKELGDLAAARKSLERALKLAPNDMRIVEAYEKIGMVSKGRRQERIDL